MQCHRWKLTYPTQTLSPVSAENGTILRRGFTGSVSTRNPLRHDSQLASDSEGGIVFSETCEEHRERIPDRIQGTGPAVETQALSAWPSQVLMGNGHWPDS